MTTILITYLFAPDIWGTVSDWVMIFVTLVTAALLLFTLNSQKDVQRVQTELYRIEDIKFRESIKPILKYSASTDIFKPCEADKKILTLQITNETNSIALNISRIFPSSELTNQVLIPTGLTDKLDHLTKGDKPLLFHFLINPVLSWTIFTLNYQDIAGTKYKQTVICICDNLGIEIHPSLPEIITIENEDLKTKTEITSS